MIRSRKDGPKRLRFTRRELPYGQIRRWGSTVGNFKAEREARRAGLSGGGHHQRFTDPSRASASYAGEARSSSSRETKRGVEEEETRES